VSIPGTGISYRKEESWHASDDPDNAPRSTSSLTAVAVIAIALAVSLVAIAFLVARLS
jgi:hypothetical protein